MTERETLAAELALGLLTGEELLAARGLRSNDPGFAALLADWEAKLAPLFDEIEPVEPDTAIWAKIAASIDSAPQGGEVVALQRRVRIWQWTAGVSAAAAVALALFAGPVLLAPRPAADAPPLVATISLPTTQVRLGLTFLPERGDLMVTAAGLSADGVHDHELWLVPASGQPLSLGVVVPGTARRVHLPTALAARLRAGATVALSREALGGSRTGVPGPVVTSAKFSST